MSRPEPFRHVAVIGLGLLGGSLAHALRRLPDRPRITAWSLEPAALARARAEGVIDVVATDSADAVRDTDLVVYATPVGATLELLETHRTDWRDDAVLTDLGSVKRAVVDRARALGLGGRFVGGHPVAGTHRSGFDAAEPALYDGATVWLVPVEPARGPATDWPALDRVSEFWKAIGARPRRIDAERHDRMMAWVSHLPQLAATALGAALAASGEEPERLGPGGRDTTRLAESPARLWADILAHNADLLERPLAELQTVIAALAVAVQQRDTDEVVRIFDAARQWRERV